MDEIVSDSIPEIVIADEDSCDRPPDTELYVTEDGEEEAPGFSNIPESSPDRSEADPPRIAAGRRKQQNAMVNRNQSPCCSIS
jgi:hypothetical protein